VQRRSELSWRKAILAYSVIYDLKNWVQVLERLHENVGEFLLEFYFRGAAGTDRNGIRGR